MKYHLMFHGLTNESGVRIQFDLRVVGDGVQYFLFISLFSFSFTSAH
jgi:hypothetical protein